MQIHKLRMGHRVTCLAVCLVVMLSYEGVLSQEVKDCSSGFKQGAEQFVQVQYRMKNRRGTAKQVVTEAEVLWQPQEMLSEASCYDLQQTTLLYKPVWRPEQVFITLVKIPLLKLKKSIYKI